MTVGPSVTICIATFNRAALLERAIVSVVEQSYRFLDVCIVNDGSIDATETVISKWKEKDNRIRVIKHSDNKGLAAARNSAISTAEGKYFTFIDDDDNWDKHFIECCVQTAEKKSEEWCYATSFEYRDNIGTRMHYIPDFNGSLKKYIMQGYTPPVASQFYVTNTVRRVGGYCERIRSGVDHDLWLSLAVAGCSLGSVPDAVAFPNVVLSNDRETTRFEERSRKIRASLLEWRKSIQEDFGEQFYKHFSSSYEYFLRKKQCFAELQRKQFCKGFSTFWKAPFKLKLIASLITKAAETLKYKNKSSMKIFKPISPSFPPFREKLR